MKHIGRPPLDHPAFDINSLVGMKPWACTYTHADGKKRWITIYGLDSKQVLEDNCDSLKNLTIDGIMCAIIPADDKECWKVIDDYEGKRT